MTDSAWAFGALLVICGTFFLSIRHWTNRKKKEPPAEWEDALASVRGRISDLDDRFEHWTKRDTMRARRGKQEDVPVEMDRSTRLRDLQARIALRR